MDEISFSEKCRLFAENSDLKKVELWIYGAGKGGRLLLQALENKGIKVYGFYDKDSSIDVIDNLPVKNLCKADVKKQHIAISLMNYSEEVTYKLLKAGFDTSRIYPIVHSNIWSCDVEDKEYKGTRIGRFT